MWQNTVSDIKMMFVWSLYWWKNSNWCQKQELFETSWLWEANIKFAKTIAYYISQKQELFETSWLWEVNTKFAKTIAYMYYISPNSGFLEDTI